MKQFFMLAGCCIWLACSSCGHHSEEKETSTQFIVTQPILYDTVLQKEYVAQIRSIQHIELRAQERGYLQEIFVDEGQFVKKGNSCFRLCLNCMMLKLKKPKLKLNSPK